MLFPPRAQGISAVGSEQLGGDADPQNLWPFPKVLTIHTCSLKTI